MSASDLRLEDISLFNYIKHEVLPVKFSEQLQGESLVYNSVLGGYVADTSMEPNPTSLGRGWVLFDDNTVGNRVLVDTTAEQTTKVSVVGPTTYDIDYKNGVIKNYDVEPTSVSYYWNYVSVLDAWPGTNPPDLPIVAIDITGSMKEGFQLGAGVKNIRDVVFSIFATTKAERDDLSDAMYDAVYNKYITINDFSSGGYLNYDGTYNGVTPSNLNGANMYFYNIKHNNINVWSDFSDLNKYRSEVRCSYESFIDNPY